MIESVRDNGRYRYVVWFSGLLTVDHKRGRMISSKDYSAFFHRNPDELLRRFLTMDQNGIIIAAVGRLGLSGSAIAEKCQGWSISQQNLVVSLSDACSIIHIDYPRKIRTINGKYNANWLDWFNNNMMKKLTHSAKKSVLFLEFNANVLRSVVIMTKYNWFIFLWSDTSAERIFEIWHPFSKL